MCRNSEIQSNYFQFDLEISQKAWRSYLACSFGAFLVPSFGSFSASSSVAAMGRACGLRLGTAPGASTSMRFSASRLACVHQGRLAAAPKFIDGHRGGFECGETGFECVDFAHGRSHGFMAGDLKAGGGGMVNIFTFQEGYRHHCLRHDNSFPTSPHIGPRSIAAPHGSIFSMEF